MLQTSSLKVGRLRKCEEAGTRATKELLKWTEDPQRENETKIVVCIVEERRKKRTRT
jgi:hypothetical protein